MSDQKETVEIAKRIALKYGFQNSEQVSDRSLSMVFHQLDWHVQALQESIDQNETDYAALKDQLNEAKKYHELYLKTANELGEAEEFISAVAQDKFRDSQAEAMEYLREVGSEEFPSPDTYVYAKRQRDSLRLEISALKEQRDRAIKALEPFAKCEPINMGAISPDKTWLWKPSNSHADTNGISAAHIFAAKEALVESSLNLTATEPPEG